MNSKAFSTFFNVFNSNLLSKTYSKKLSEQTIQFIKSNAYYAEVHKLDNYHKKDEIVQFQVNQKYMDLVGMKNDQIFNKASWQQALNAVVSKDWVQSYIDRFSRDKLDAFLTQCPAIAIDSPIYFSDSSHIISMDREEKKFNFILGFEEEYVEEMSYYKIIYNLIC